MLCGDVGVAPLPMLNGLVQLRNPCVDMPIPACLLGMLQRSFCTCQEGTDVTLFAVVSCFLGEL